MERGQRGASQGHRVPEQLAQPLPFLLPLALGPEASTLRLSRRSSQPAASHHVRLSPQPRLQGGSWARWPHCCTLKFHGTRASGLRCPYVSVDLASQPAGTGSLRGLGAPASGSSHSGKGDLP